MNESLPVSQGRFTDLQAVVFDFDFTLADGADGVLECIHYAMDALGRPLPDAGRARETIGLTLQAGWIHLTGDHSAVLQQRYHDLFIERADEILADRTDLMPGIVGAMERLVAEGLSLAIVSTKHRGRIEKILDRFQARRLFRTIVGGNDVREHKPDPEGLRLAIARLGVTHAQVLYVGDHQVDATAAARAPVPFAAVLTGTTSRAVFERTPHQVVLPSVLELPGWLGYGP